MGVTISAALQRGNTLPTQKTKPDFSHPPCPKKLLQPVLSRAKNAFRTPPKHICLCAVGAEPTQKTFFFSALRGCPETARGLYPRNAPAGAIRAHTHQQTLPTRKGVLRCTNSQPPSKRFCLTLNAYRQNVAATRRIGDGCNNQHGTPAGQYAPTRKKQNPASRKNIWPEETLTTVFFPELKTHSELPKHLCFCTVDAEPTQQTFFPPASARDAPKPLGDYTRGTTLRRTARIPVKQTLPTRKGFLSRTKPQPPSKRLIITLNDYG